MYRASSVCMPIQLLHHLTNKPYMLYYSYYRYYSIECTSPLKPFKYKTFIQRTPRRIEGSGRGRRVRPSLRSLRPLMCVQTVPVAVYGATLGYPPPGQGVKGFHILSVGLGRQRWHHHQHSGYVLSPAAPSAAPLNVFCFNSESKAETRGVQRLILAIDMIRYGLI